MRANPVIVLLLLTSTLQSLAQPLNGTYTIGASPANYSNVTAAVSALSTLGVSGPVTFQIDSGLYEEQVNITAITGASLSNTITFKGITGDSTQVIVSFPSSASLANNYVINFQDAAYIRFEDISLMRSLQNPYARVVVINGNSHHLNFNSCSLLGATVNNTGIYQVLVYGLVNGGQRDITFNSCRFTGGNYGIYLLGPGQINRATGIIVSSCLFQDNFAGHIRISYFASPVQISTCKMYEYDLNSGFSSIYLENCALDYRIERNFLYFKAGAGIKLSLTSGYSIQQGLIANNIIISDTIGGVGGLVTGLIISNSGTSNLYYNSIFIRSPYPSSSCISITGMTSTDLSAINNNLLIDSGLTIVVDTTSTAPFSSSHHNNLYSSGPNLVWYRFSGQLPNLSTYQSLTGLENSSKSVMTNFLADGIRHNTPELDDAGSSALSSLNNVNIDYFGMTRDSLSPDIGATEFEHFRMEIAEIDIDTTLCTNESSPVRIRLRNAGPGVFEGGASLQVFFDQNAHPVWTPVIPQPFGGYDTLTLLYDTAMMFNTVSVHQISVAGYFDANPITNKFDTAWSDTIRIKIPYTDFLGADTMICISHPFLLQPTQPFITFQWYDGSSQPALFLPAYSQSAGILPISLAAKDGYCTSYDTLLLEVDPCSGIDEYGANILAAYPNPCVDHITLQMPENFVPDIILIINAEGAIVKKLFTTDLLNQVDISDLKPGYHHFVVINSFTYLHCPFMKL